MLFQIKDIKHIEQDFCSDASSCQRVGLWGARGAQGGKKIENGHAAYQIDGDDK